MMMMRCMMTSMKTRVLTKELLYLLSSHVLIKRWQAATKDCSLSLCGPVLA